MPDVVAVQEDGQHAVVEQASLERLGHGRLARSAQPGQPDGDRPPGAREARALRQAHQTGLAAQRPGFAQGTGLGLHQAVDQHACGHRGVGLRVDQDQGPGGAVGGVGIPGDRLEALDGHAPDLVEPERLRRLAVQRVGIDAVAERGDRAAQGAGRVPDQVGGAGSQRRLAHPDHHGLDLACELRHVVRRTEQIAAADVDFVLQAERDRLSLGGGGLLACEGDDRLDARALA